MKKQWIAAVAVMSIFAIGVTGCKKEDVAIEAEVQEEVDKEAIEEAQNKIIAEYAANVLMKYNSGSSYRVLDGQKLLVEEAKEDALKAQEEKRQQLREEYQSKEKEEKKEEEVVDASSDSSAHSVNTEEIVTPQVQYLSDMATAMSLPSFSIMYSGYEVTNSYEGNMSSFTVDAATGKALVIAKFNVTNIGSQEEELDILALAPEFKLNINNRIIKAQQTMLLNDLSMYKEMTAMGEVKETVIIFEVDQELAAALGNMELIVKINEQESRMLLEGSSSINEVVQVPAEESSEEVSEEGIESEIQEEETLEAEPAE